MIRTLFAALLLWGLTSGPVVAGPANDPITSAGQAFVGSAVSGVSAGNRSFVQLWNPVASGVDLFVDKLVCANSQTSIPSAADLRPSFAPLGTVHLNGFNRIVGGVPSKAEIRAGHLGSLPAVTGRMHEFWLSGPRRDVSYAFDPALKVPPGHGLLAAQWVPSEHTICSWHWRETENTDPPPPTPIPGGVPFGNMTQNGGLAAGFDGTTAQNYVASAVLGPVMTEAAFLGKDFSGTPQAVGSVRVFPSSDEHFDGNDGALDFQMYGSQTPPLDPSDGVLLGSLMGVADGPAVREIVSQDTVTAWAYVWLRVASGTAGKHHFAVAEVQFFTPD